MLAMRSERSMERVFKASRLRNYRNCWYLFSACNLLAVVVVLSSGKINRSSGRHGSTAVTVPPFEYCLTYTL